MRPTKRITREGKVEYFRRVQVGGVLSTYTGGTLDEFYKNVSDAKDLHKRRRLGLPLPEAPPEEVVYDELCERFLEGYPHASQTRRTITHTLRRPRAHFGRVLFRDLRKDRIEAWLARLPLAQQTRRNVLKAMRQVEIWGEESGYGVVRAARKAEMPKEPPYKRQGFETWAEVERVADALSDPAHGALVRFVCATGLRPQEWRALRWGDIDREKRRLAIRRTVRNGAIREGEAKTEESLRIVLLSERARVALDSLPTPLRRDWRDQLVFPGKRGGVLDVKKWSENHWRPALSTAGVAPRPPKAMRDTFATLGLADGMPVQVVSKQIGHTDLEVTMKHYATVLESHEYGVLDALNARHAEQTRQKADTAAEGAQ